MTFQKHEGGVWGPEGKKVYFMMRGIGLQVLTLRGNNSFQTLSSGENNLRKPTAVL